MKRLPLYIQVLPVYAVIAGLLVMPGITNQRMVRQTQAEGARVSAKIASSSSASTTLVKISGHPTRILLPRLGIDLAVVNGTYNPVTQKWSVAHSSANYATSTSLPNNTSGSTLVYGHWYEYVLGKTKNLQPNDILYVYTDNGHVLKYQYTGASIVNPNDTQVLARNSSSAELNLMTCDGTWAQHRRIMNFKFVGVA